MTNCPYGLVPTEEPKVLPETRKVVAMGDMRISCRSIIMHKSVVHDTTAEPVVFVLVLYHVIVRNAFYNSCWEMTQSSTDDSSCVRAAVLLRFFLLFYSLNLMLWDVYWEHKKKMLFSETRVACKFSLSFIKEQRSPRHCCLHYDIPYNY